jgi:hypothetical protein
VAGLLLVTSKVYSQWLASYWSPRRYIPSGWPPIGHLEGIFPVAGLLLVTSKVYSQWLASYWSPRRYIPSGWPPIGHLEGIFPVAGLLLVTSKVYSQWLASYWTVLLLANQKAFELIDVIFDSLHNQVTPPLQYQQVPTCHALKGLGFRV